MFLKFPSLQSELCHLVSHMPNQTFPSELQGRVSSVLFPYIPGTKAELTVLFLRSVCLLPKKYQAAFSLFVFAFSGFNRAFHGPIFTPSLSLVAQLCLTLYHPMNCGPPASSVHENSPGKKRPAPHRHAHGQCPHRARVSHRPLSARSLPLPPAGALVLSPQPPTCCHPGTTSSRLT